MKRNYTLTKEDMFYILKDTNPNRNDEPFKIGINELIFDTSSFYDYVFKGVSEEYEISIDNNLNPEDKVGAVIYKTIDEIAREVLIKLKK